MSRAAIALCCLLAFVPTVADAAIFDRDDRVAVTLKPVGIVTGGEKVYYGSGFLIDRCNVLSARHVAGNVLIAVGRRLMFRSGRSASPGTVVAAGPFQDNLSPTRSIGADWMLVRLDRCLGRKLGFLRVMSTVDAYAAERGAGDAGFPRDRPMRSGPTVDAECRVLWVGGGRMAHDCATIAGNSGGPILARKSDNWIAIGINVAGEDRRIPFARSAYDYVICLGVLQHTPSPEASLESLWTMVKPGGRLVIDHYRWRLRFVLPTPFGSAESAYRLVTLRLPEQARGRFVEVVTRFWFPIHWKFRNSRFAQRLIRRFSPVHFYYPDIALAGKAEFLEWALLDTHVTDWEDWWSKTLVIWLQAMSLEKPGAMLPGGDYRHFRRFIIPRRL